MAGISNLGIDLYSILIYIVNFGVLLIILTHFLYKPVLQLLDKRKNYIAERLNEAEKIKQEFSAKLKEMEEEEARVKRELKDELDRMETFVAESQAKMKQEMEADRQKLMEKTNKEITARKEKILQEAEAEVKKLIQKIILEIVRNKVPEEVVGASIQDAWEKYR